MPALMTVLMRMQVLMLMSSRDAIIGSQFKLVGRNSAQSFGLSWVPYERDVFVKQIDGFVPFSAVIRYPEDATQRGYKPGRCSGESVL